MTDAPAERKPSPAELFERFFGPSIFVPSTEVLLQHARPSRGERALDLACATGIVARRIAPAVGDEGDVVGVDINPEMLAVAREEAASEGVTVEWRQNDAAELDMPDDAFDLVVCQQGLQFFSEPARALREVRRVLDDGGRLVLNVWQPLERHPVYRALMEAEARHLGADLTEVATPFVFGDEVRLRTLLEEAGFDRVDVAEDTLDVTFGDPETFVALTVMAASAVMPDVAHDDPDQRAELIQAIARDSEDVLQRHRRGNSLSFPMPNYIATAHA